MARRITNITADGTAFNEISLEKLVGHKITQVRGYVAAIQGDPYFKLTRIDFANGEWLDVEGEHDMPYLLGDVGNHNETILAALYDEE